MSATRVTIGKINGVYGVKGWVKVFSYTDPPRNILTYVPWQVFYQGQWQEWDVVDSEVMDKKIAVRFAHCADRDIAAQLMGAEIAIWRSQLPHLTDDEFYWSDLIGLTVINHQQIVLGKVTGFIETGANDVIVVQGERERLIPFVLEHVVTQLSVATKTIYVQWDADF